MAKTEGFLSDGDVNDAADVQASIEEAAGATFGDPPDAADLNQEVNARLLSLIVVELENIRATLQMLNEEVIALHTTIRERQ